MLVDLKVAIVRSGKTQRQIAFETLIPEVRLSSIVRGAVPPKPAEALALDRCLGLKPGSVAAESENERGIPKKR